MIEIKMVSYHVQNKLDTSVTINLVIYFTGITIKALLVCNKSELLLCSAYPMGRG